MFIHCLWFSAGPLSVKIHSFNLGKIWRRRTELVLFCVCLLLGLGFWALGFFPSNFLSLIFPCSFLLVLQLFKCWASMWSFSFISFFILLSPLGNFCHCIFYHGDLWAIFKDSFGFLHYLCFFRFLSWCLFFTLYTIFSNDCDWKKKISKWVWIIMSFHSTDSKEIINDY